MPFSTGDVGDGGRVTRCMATSLRVRRTVRRVLLLASMGLGMPIGAQRPTVQRNVALGVLWQSAPSFIWERGVLVDAGIRIPVGAWLYVHPNLEMSRSTFSGSGGDICIPVDRQPTEQLPRCFDRPLHEVTGGLGVRLEGANTTHNRRHLRGAIGFAVLRSFEQANPGERAHFVVPEAALGVGSRLTGPAWGMEARLRRLSRWGTEGPHTQLALRTFVTW